MAASHARQTTSSANSRVGRNARTLLRAASTATRHTTPRSSSRECNSSNLPLGPPSMGIDLTDMDHERMAIGLACLAGPLVRARRR